MDASRTQAGTPLSRGTRGPGQPEHFATSDPHAVRRHILEYTEGRCQFSLRDSRKFAHFSDSRATLGATVLRRLRWTGESACETVARRSREQILLLHFPLAGEFEAEQDRHRARVRPGQMLLVSAPGAVRRHWQGSCELFNIAMERRALERVLAQEFGISVKAPLAFRPMTVAEAEQAVTLRDFILLILQDMERPAPAFAHAAMAHQAERMLLLLLLRNLPHNYSEQMARDPGSAEPWYVGVVAEHIHANVGRELGLAELARLAGVSPRTLQYGFRRHHGATPLQYLKQVRLERAREALVQARSNGERITDIAGRVGYGSASRFSRDYRERYGEPPSVTRLRP